MELMEPLSQAVRSRGLAHVHDLNPPDRALRGHHAGAEISRQPSKADPVPILDSRRPSSCLLPHNHLDTRSVLDLFPELLKRQYHTFNSTEEAKSKYGIDSAKEDQRGRRSMLTDQAVCRARIVARDSELLTPGFSCTCHRGIVAEMLDGDGASRLWAEDQDETIGTVVDSGRGPVRHPSAGVLDWSSPCRYICVMHLIHTSIECVTNYLSVIPLRVSSIGPRPAEYF